MDNIFSKLLGFFGFSVLLGLLPFLFQLVRIAINHDKSRWSKEITNVINRGEVFIVCVGLAMGGAGELVISSVLHSSPLGTPIPSIGMIVISLVIALACTIAYSVAFVATESREGRPLGDNADALLLAGSKWALVSTIVAASICIGLAAATE